MSIDPSTPPSTPPPTLEQVTPPPAAAEPAAPSPAPAAPAAATPMDPKTVAIISYLWVPGIIVAYVMAKGQPKNSYVNFHMRQALGLTILSVAGLIVFSILGIVTALINGGLHHAISLLADLYYLAVFVPWLLSFIPALNNQEKETLVLGPIFHKMFAKIFPA